MKTIRINGIIGEEENSLDRFIARVEALQLEPNEPLRVVINSQGGSVFDGFGIYNFLVSLKNEVHTEIESLSASIATLVALAAKKENTSISELSQFMIHQASTGAQGNALELNKQAGILNSIDETLVSIYSRRTGMSRDEISALMAKETWMTSQQAVDLGFIGNIINTINSRMAALSNNNINENNMTKLKDLLAKFTGSAEPAPAPAASAPAPTNAVDPNTGEVVPGPPVPGETVPAATPESQVTREEFDNLVEIVMEIAGAVDEIREALKPAEPTTTPAEPLDVEAIGKAAIAAYVKSLPTSQATPQASNTPVAKMNGWSQPFAKQREMQKEIEKKTRNR